MGGWGRCNARRMLQESWGEHCGYCRRRYHESGSRRFSIDHYTPQSLGGSNRLENLVASCKGCNEDKSSHETLKWMKSRGFDVVNFLERRDQWCSRVWWYRWHLLHGKDAEEAMLQTMNRKLLAA